MSTNPTIRIAERRRYIAERTAQLQSELEQLTAEGAELDVAERVLRRFSEPPSVGGPITKVIAPAAESLFPQTNGADEAEVPTLPQMVFTILEEAKAAGRKGADGNEILRIIQQRWKPNFTPDNVRPTLWRMVKKEGRLRKRGKIYSLPMPPSSPEGETGALGAPAHH